MPSAKPPTLCRWPDALCSAPAMTRAISRRQRPTRPGKRSPPPNRRQHRRLHQVRLPPSNPRRRKIPWPKPLRPPASAPLMRPHRRRLPPRIHGAAEHGGPSPAALRNRHQSCLFPRRAHRYRPEPQSVDTRRLGAGAAGGDRCRHRASRISSGADSERARGLRAPSCAVPEYRSAGFITSNSAEVIPQLAITYLLLDFGGRAAAVKEASQQSIAANAAFSDSASEADLQRGPRILHAGWCRRHTPRRAAGLGGCAGAAAIRRGAVQPRPRYHGRSPARSPRDRASAVRSVEDKDRAERRDVLFARGHGLATDHEAARGKLVHASAATAQFPYRR